MPDTRRGRLRLAAIVAVLGTGGVIAGELRPLPVPPVVPAQSPTTDQRAALERYYLEFATRARPLSATQRAQLSQEFETMRQAAERAGRPGESAHYSRLISILEQMR